MSGTYCTLVIVSESVDGLVVGSDTQDQKSPLPFTISANSLGGVDNSHGEQPLINNFTETQVGSIFFRYNSNNSLSSSLTPTSSIHQN